MKNRKGQSTLGDAPTIVLIVGLLFLVMATIAFIGQKYGEAIPSSLAGTMVNDSLTTVTESGEIVSNWTACNFEDFAVTQCVNATNGHVINALNYTTTTIGYIIYSGGDDTYPNNTNWKCSYTYSYAGDACLINKELESNISSNTSIAGIVLTISLVGIVLTVLIGVFIGVRRTRI